MAEEKTAVHSIRALVGASGSQQPAYLIMISAKSAAMVGKMTKLGDGETVLGRAPDVGLQIEDDGVSRRHCKVVGSSTGYFQLIDLGSTNGTYLNGSRVDVAKLEDGDKIQVGSNTVLKFTRQDHLEENYQRSIYESATRDGLTRVFNKKYFLEALRKEFAYCLRHRVPLSVVMLDIDFFKRINDTFGHPAGDAVLQKVSQRVAETVRTEDLFARYGGEEFALMLRESTAEAAVRCAERCRRAVDASEIIFNGTPIKVTVSLGVATLDDRDLPQPEDLIAEADKYLYRAKRAGRNRVGAAGLLDDD